MISRVPIPVKEGVEEPSAKVNVLLQAYISRLKLEGFALVADMTYVQQSACRLMRCLFEIALKRGWASLSTKILTICKMCERRIWGSQSPLRQFGSIPDVIVRKLEKNSDIPWERCVVLHCHSHCGCIVIIVLLYCACLVVTLSLVCMNSISPKPLSCSLSHTHTYCLSHTLLFLTYTHTLTHSHTLSLRYADLKPQDLGEMVKIPKMGKTLYKFVHMFPKLLVNAHVLPLTRSLLQIDLTITPDFEFDTGSHDQSQVRREA